MYIKITLLCIALLVGFFSRTQAPLADFSASPLVACVGETISFTSTSSANGGAPLQEFVWDFGDGNSASEEAVVHSYSLPGTMFGGTQQDLHGFVTVIGSQ